MVYLWIVIGVIAVSIAFFLPPQSSEIWRSLNTAGIVAAVYLLVVILFVLRNPVPMKHRIIVGLVSLVCAVALIAHWTGMKNTTLYQQQQLSIINSVIQRGIISYECPQKLLTVLEKYHKQGKVKKETIGNVFIQTFPASIVGSNIHEKYQDNDSLRLFVTGLSDSMITITASHAFAKGRSAEFVPYWGRKGTLQERYTLTAKGVSHESDN